MGGGGFAPNLLGYYAPAQLAGVGHQGWSSGAVQPAVVQVTQAPVESGWGSIGTTTAAPTGWGSGAAGSSASKVVAIPVAVQPAMGYGGLGGTGAQLTGGIWQPIQQGLQLGLGVLGVRSGNVSAIVGDNTEKKEVDTAAAKPSEVPQISHPEEAIPPFGKIIRLKLYVHGKKKVRKRKKIGQKKSFKQKQRSLLFFRGLVFLMERSTKKTQHFYCIIS